MVYRGLGWIAIVIPMAVIFVTSETIPTSAHMSRFGIAGASIAIAGGIVFGVARLLDQRAKPITVLEPITGLPRQVLPRHDLYFVQIRYWGVVEIIAGLVVTALAFAGVG